MDQIQNLRKESNTHISKDSYIIQRLPNYYNIRSRIRNQCKVQIGKRVVVATVIRIAIRVHALNVIRSPHVCMAAQNHNINLVVCQHELFDGRKRKECQTVITMDIATCRESFSFPACGCKGISTRYLSSSSSTCGSSGPTVLLHGRK